MKNFKSNSTTVNKKRPFEAKGVLGENSLKDSHFAERWRANSGAQLNSFTDKNTNAWESKSMHLLRFASVC